MRVYKAYLASDFSDHDNPLGFWVVGEPLQAIDEVGPVERIAPNTDARALTHAYKHGEHGQNRKQVFRSQIFISRQRNRNLAFAGHA